MVASVGGIPAGNEQRLVTVVRLRLNAKYEDMSNVEVQLRAFLHATEPIVHYIQASVAAETLNDMNKENFGEFVHRLFLTTTARTRLVEKYVTLLDSQQQWRSVEAGLKMILDGDGTASVAPALCGRARAKDQVRSLAATVWPPRWSSRRSTTAGILLWSMSSFYFHGLFEPIRNRFYVLTISGLLSVGALTYWWLGPKMWPYFL